MAYLGLNFRLPLGRHLDWVRPLMLVLACLGTALPALAGEVLDRIKSSGTLNIGYRAAGAPFSYKAPDGSAMGYSIDLCQHLAQAIAKQVGVAQLKVNYVPVTGSDRIVKIVNGSLDLECANTTNSKSRREQVAFGLTHYYAAAKLLVRQGSGVRSLDDLNGKTIALGKGTTSLQIVEARNRTGGKFNLLLVESSKDGANAVEQGRADATMNDDILLLAFAREAQKAKLEVVGPPMSIEPLAIMHSKNDPQLATLVQNEMGRLYREGVARQLYEKWFMGALPHLGYSLQAPMTPLLNDNFRRPSGYVTDWTIL
ncbi:amino acid ABC transporter substrate-binding protein [Ottowia testudinis]|uniref:Amino acid ABC transporter substrate-binding protein n=1 Tax=Ottowia testudinis TaxID=2816950 RepID=A0A975CIT8_9BURK|nr:amino acid ABC transporter substrate-binding protein [Ottowia testudinis]QTD45757.1 amino acid ABC transporter substrate-binding protein [Ottowia testudinis]